MAALSELKYMPFGPCNFVGKFISAKPLSQDISTFWMRCSEDGSIDGLLQFADAATTPFGTDLIGYMCSCDPQNQMFNYGVGLFLSCDAPIPNGYESRPVPACEVACGSLTAPESEIYAQLHCAMETAIQQAGRRPDNATDFECEIYSLDGYCIPKSQGSPTVTISAARPVQPL